MSKTLLKTLRDMALTEYGSVISGDMVREILGLEVPEYGRRDAFNEIALKEMAAIGYVRDQLLNEGKYIGQVNGNYRVFLPSENKAQADAYEASADRKLRRAQKLLKNTPASDSYCVKTDKSAIIAMKRLSIRRKAYTAPCGTAESMAP